MCDMRVICVWYVCDMCVIRVWYVICVWYSTIFHYFIMLTLFSFSAKVLGPWKNIWWGRNTWVIYAHGANCFAHMNKTNSLHNTLTGDFSPNFWKRLKSLSQQCHNKHMFLITLTLNLLKSPFHRKLIMNTHRLPRRARTVRIK